MAIKIGLVGTGTVGGGCLDILDKHKDDFVHQYGIELELVRVCSLEKEEMVKRGLGDIFTTDYKDVVTDPEVDIVIELIGGTGIAKDVIFAALENGKHVVTANKAVMASAGSEVIDLARQKGLELAFEASVGGGIPIISPLRHSLMANEITSVMGIVNGTTNYMLTRMNQDKMSYDEALAEAQALGYAEADPTADVDGHDAAAKIAILAAIAFNAQVDIEDVYVEGIRSISPVDLDKAKDMGYAVKLVAHAHRRGEGIEVRVHPTMVPADHQLAAVNGVFNAIYVIGDFVGETMYFGEGAGAGAAASAVMGDVLEVARHLQMGTKPINDIASLDALPIIPMDELNTKYYLRFTVEDRPGVLAACADVFAKYDVSIQSVDQRGTKSREEVNLVFITHTACEGDMRKAIKEILSLDNMVTGGFPVVIRVQD